MMEPPPYAREREELPGTLKIPYKDFKDKLKEYDLWDSVNLNDEEYSNSDIVAEVKYRSYHESWGKGELQLHVVEGGPEREIKLSQVAEVDVASILNGETMITDGEEQEISMKGEYNQEAATD